MVAAVLRIDRFPEVNDGGIDLANRVARLSQAGRDQLQ